MSKKPQPEEGVKVKCKEPKKPRRAFKFDGSLKSKIETVDITLYTNGEPKTETFPVNNISFTIAFELETLYLKDDGRQMTVVVNLSNGKSPTWHMDDLPKDTDWHSLEKQENSGSTAQ